MPEPIRGIHHITAIASDPQRNLDFYTRVLGLRLVKLTINFDDPGTYHFYFGDSTGHPGTILTFFPWSNIRRGRHGTGQVGMVAFNIPQNSIRFWMDRFKQLGITNSSPFRRFDEEVMTLLDPDGLSLELVASSLGASGSTPWESNGIPAEHAIRGFSQPTLLLEGFEQTANLLTGVFGMTQVQQSGSRFRFLAGETGAVSAAGGQVDVEVRPDEPTGGLGAGVVHHIAWRTWDDAQQLAWRDILVERGLNVTPVMDRNYFHSIYFREPGGILFEIATDPPGFAIDELVEALGSRLQLPAWLEPHRAEIEAALPTLKLPETQKPHAR
jgi:catechol 2,3-dioxygenase-like lactoylglutathione lyase family enzyme